MQKLPFDTVRREAHIEANKWARFRLYLKSIGKTFSKWVRDKIDQELETKANNIDNN